MGIKTSDEAKELFVQSAGSFRPEDITVLKELSATGSTPPVKLAGQLLVSPNAAHNKLRRAAGRGGLVASVQRAKRDIFASEEDEYFALSDEGEEMINHSAAG